MRSSIGLADGGVGGGARMQPAPSSHPLPTTAATIASGRLDAAQLDQNRATMLARNELRVLQEPTHAPHSRALKLGQRAEEATGGGQIHQSSLVSSSNLQQQVRELIAQYSLELILLCVIIIYLVYYFAKVSRGNESNDEMPRSKFKRQFLYVSDAQYLASNVDLSEHYEKKKQRQQLHLRLVKHQRLASQRAELQQRPTSQMGENLRLAVDMSGEGHLLACGRQDEACIKQAAKRLSSDNGQCAPAQRANTGAATEVAATETTSTKNKRSPLKHQFSSGSSSSSSTSGSNDSGVFAACQTSSSASSSSLTIDMSSSSDEPGAAAAAVAECRPLAGQAKESSGCSCVALYSCAQSSPSCFAPAPADASHHQQQQQQQSLHREELEFGQCALDWHLDSHRNYHENKQVALISAGMTTGSDKKYVTDTVRTLEQLGYEVCVFIRRGVGGLKLSSTKFFSPSKWRDFEAAIVSVRRQRPGARLVAIGFSFGSIELCRYLSMSGPSSLVDFALLISCPFDPEAGGRNMRKRALNRKIDAYLAKNLGKQLYQALTFSTQDSAATSETTETGASSSSLDSEMGNMATSGTSEQSFAEINATQHNKQSELSPSSSSSTFSNYNGSLVDLSRLPKIKSLVDFEDNYNRIIQNYPDSDAYAADSRLNDHLLNIETPTLCLSSEDDFMAPLKLLPLKQIEENKNLCMILTKRGGHMAFIDGLVWPRKPYFAQRIISKYIRTISALVAAAAAEPMMLMMTDPSDDLAKPNDANNVREKMMMMMTNHRTINSCNGGGLAGPGLS